MVQFLLRCKSNFMNILRQRSLTFRNLSSSAKSESSGLISCSIKAENKAAASHWLFSSASAGLGVKPLQKHVTTSSCAASKRRPSLFPVRWKVSYRRLHAVVALLFWQLFAVTENKTPRMTNCALKMSSLQKKKKKMIKTIRNYEFRLKMSVAATAS